MQNSSEPSRAPNQSPIAFDLRLMFYVVSLFAAGLAISPVTILTTILILLFWLACFGIARSYKPQDLTVFFILFVLAGFCCTGALMPAVSRVREASRRMMCMNNMRQLGLALLNYESTNKRFPNAANLVNGIPHSWRVAILPYIEEQTLYSTYNQSLAWNSPTNIKISQTNVWGFCCPSTNHAPKTTYKLVTGPGTLFESGGPPTFDKIKDGTANTIIMIEDATNPVAWTGPNGDIDIEEAIELLSSTDVNRAIHFSSEPFKTTYFGPNVLMADGSVHQVGFGADPKLLKQFFLCADGSIPDVKVSELGRHFTVYKYGVIIATSIYVLLALVPIIPLRRLLAEERRQETEFV